MLAGALRLLVVILAELGDGDMVKLMPVHAEMTTKAAADAMSMSRPSFIKLLNEQHIPFHRVGNRREVKYSDVVAYKQQLDQKRLESLGNLARLDQSMGLGY